jgi:hypothetical protein
MGYFETQGKIWSPLWPCENEFQLVKPNSARLTRRNHSDEFKATVTLEAIKENKTMSELCQIHGISAAQISDLKLKLFENATDVFKGTKRQRDTGPNLTHLHAKIGE